MGQKLNDDFTIGSMDMDSEDRSIAVGDYKYANNVRNAINTANRGGSLTNVMGMIAPDKYLLPYTNNIFPAGENRCIGAFEDTKYGTVIFFVWNSQENHQILRYYPNNVDPANPYGEIQQIIKYPFAWGKTTRITSSFVVYGDPENDLEDVGDLLYWTDPVPHKINLTKGNVVNKQKSWNVYLPVTCAFPATVTFLFKDFSGTVLQTTEVGLSDPTNRETIIGDISSSINLITASVVTAESCDCHLLFTESVAGTVWTIEVDTDLILISPDNWYGAVLIERFFDRCKYPPLQSPRGTFLQDVNYEPNYVQRKVFQFRVEYIYDDREDSALGVWSQIPINNLGCDGTSNPLLNYIDVNFEDDLVVDETVLVLLKRIRFIARELNTGKDRSVIDLEPCDFLDYDYTNNVWYAHFKFYNDIISSAIDDATAAKIFDDVPRESEAEVFKENRIVEGNCITGYNAPDCIDAKPQMEFGDVPNPKLWKVTGRVRIKTDGLIGSGVLDAQGNFYGTIASPTSSYAPIRKYPFWEATSPFANNRIRRGGIFHDISVTDSVPFFGGGSFAPAGTGVWTNNFGITPTMDSVYDQRIPEGGFPVYAAGTNYFTISKQKNIGLPVDDSGALDTSTPDKIEAIGEYLFSNYADIPPVSPDTDLYSEFEMLLPDGTYVLRLASHWCSFGDQLQKGFAYDLAGGTQYQSTSTNVWSVIDINGVQQNVKEITVTVSGADIFVGDFLVADLAPPPESGVFGWRPLNGYLVSDENDSSDINAESFTGLSVEKTLVTYARNGEDIFVQSVSYNPVTPLSNVWYDVGWQNSCITDHNGYFFGITGVCSNDDDIGAPMGTSASDYVPISAYQNETGAPNNIKKIRDSDTLLYIGSYSDYINKTLTPLAYNGTGALVYPLDLLHFFVSANVPNSRKNASTVIEGAVVDQNGNGVPNVLAVYQTGRTAKSAQSGEYSLVAWADMLTPNLALFSSEISTFTPISNSNRTVDNLYFEGDIFCGITYPNGQFVNITIDPFGDNGTDTPPPYSPTAHYPVADFEIDESNDPSQKAHKRGGNYTYALRLYDNAGRLCSVVTAFEMYVPFITEDIGKYSIEDFSGIVYPANTFKYGKPSIKWVLSATTTFPAWATTLQWMRVKNSIYGRYLQWVANQVTYLSATATATTPEIQTSFQNADAVAIKVSLSNITGYYAANNNSQIGYQYQAGDRLRLIADRTLVNYNGLTDFEITSYDSTSQSVIIKPNGFATEILSGTLFEIFNPKSVATEDEQIFYEVGEVVKITNGIPDSFSGTFTNGDTYWRGRLIIVNDDATKFASAYPVVIEDASVSDFYISEAQDIGRIGIIDPNFKQIKRPMLLKASNAFIPSTAINGLSSFEALNEKELDRNSGAIKRLVSVNQTIVAATTQREISNYIQVVTLQQATQGEGVIAVANQYFGTEYPHTKTLGTDHAGSVFINNGQLFGYHSQRGDVFKYQGDGEATISDLKMKNYFRGLSDSGVTDAIGIYNRFTEEYILTVWREYQNESTIVSVTPVFEAGYVIGVFYPDGTPFPQVGSNVEFQYYSSGQWNTLAGYVNSITDGVDGKVVNIIVSTRIVFTTGIQVNIICSIPETISWFNGNETTNKKGWATFYDFAPEAYSQLGNGIVSFVDGRIWLHDKTTEYNKFYGTQYKSAITPVFNEKPKTMKIFQSLWLQSRQSNGLCNWSSPSVTNLYGQQSRLQSANFVKRENAFFIDFKRDITTPNVTNAIVNGRMMRSEALSVALENDATVEVVLFGYSTMYAVSERTEK